MVRQKIIRLGKETERNKNARNIVKRWSNFRKTIDFMIGRNPRTYFAPNSEFLALFASIAKVFRRRFQEINDVKLEKAFCETTPAKIFRVGKSARSRNFLFVYAKRGFFERASEREEKMHSLSLLLPPLGFFSNTSLARKERENYPRTLANADSPLVCCMRTRPPDSQQAWN